MAQVQSLENSNAFLSDMRSRMRPTIADESPQFPLLFAPTEDMAQHVQYAVNGSSPVKILSRVPVAATPDPLYHPKKKPRVADTQNSLIQEQMRSCAQVQQQQQQQLAALMPNVSTGLRLAYGDEEPTANSSAPRITNGPSMVDETSFAAEIERQRNKLNLDIRAEEEQLMQAIRDAAQRHMAALVGTVQEGYVRRVKLKEAQIESLHKRNRELSDKMKHMALEVQSWHSRARYSEAMVNALRTNLQMAVAQSREQSKEGCGDSEVDDAASSHRGAAGDDNNSINNNNRSGSNTNSQSAIKAMSEAHARILRENNELRAQRLCKMCRSNPVSILLLPCRHLCLCKHCESLMEVCPVCRFFKSASVEVNMS